MSQRFKSNNVGAISSEEKIKTDVSNWANINTETLTPRTNENKPIACINNLVDEDEALMLECVNDL